MSGRLVLASTSPRRRELLARLGVSFRVEVPAVDETPRAGEAPEALVARLAEAKARNVAARLDASAVVLAADTIVVIEAHVLGKPHGTDEATTMLAALAGREHRVLTGVALFHGGGLDRMTVVTRMWFRELEAVERDVYAASDEAQGAAGAYAIQGDAAAFVTRVVGSYSNVVGLPLAATADLLRTVGFAT